MSTTPAERKILRRDHRARSGATPNLCILCAETFPCIPIRLADEVEDLEERIDETARVEKFLSGSKP